MLLICVPAAIVQASCAGDVDDSKMETSALTSEAACNTRLQSQAATAPDANAGQPPAALPKSRKRKQSSELQQQALAFKARLTQQQAPAVGSAASSLAASSLWHPGHIQQQPLLELGHTSTPPSLHVPNLEGSGIAPQHQQPHPTAAMSGSVMQDSSTLPAASSVARQGQLPPHAQAGKKKRVQYIYGNYHGYYGYRWGLANSAFMLLSLPLLFLKSQRQS